MNEAPERISVESDEFTLDPTQSKVNIGPIKDPIYIGEEARMSENLTITTTEPLIYGPAITFEPITLEAVTFVMLNEEYKLPAVKHQHFDALMSLCAVVIKLHQRVQELEAKLKGGNGD